MKNFFLLLLPLATIIGGRFFAPVFLRIKVISAISVFYA